MNVFFTVDVEVWCDGWNDLDSRFPEAFQRYIYGPTSKGRYGLPHIVDVLNQHGLNGVFFVEPLFASRFGIQPLQEIVGLLNDAGQEIQLHMHTEWVDESGSRFCRIPRRSANTCVTSPATNRPRWWDTA